MGKVSQIDLTFDRKAFHILLETFSFMRDNWGVPGIVDPAALLITQQDATEMISKLKTGDKGDDNVTIPMNFNDWVVYGALLSQTSSNIPHSAADAYEVLEGLWEEVGRLDDAGEAPCGPAASNPLTPE